MEIDLQALLLADAGIGAIVADHIAWGVRAQGEALPALTLHNIGNVYNHTHQGRVDLVRTRVQFDIHSARYSEALAIRDAVLELFEPVSITHGGTEFKFFIDSGREETETGDADQPTIYKQSLDVIVLHKETI